VNTLTDPSAADTASRWPSFEIAAATASATTSNAFSLVPLPVFQLVASFPGPTAITRSPCGDSASPATFPAPTAITRWTVMGEMPTVLSALAVTTSGAAGDRNAPRTGPACGNAWWTAPVPA
jgi:hypothetical protein